MTMPERAGQPSEARVSANQSEERQLVEKARAWPYLHSTATFVLIQHLADVLDHTLDKLEAARRDRDEFEGACRRWSRFALTNERRAIAAESALADMKKALEEIARVGVVFDAKGTASKRINDIARAALAALESDRG
jgi:histidinol-phosphate/aromatic aminotransferase/cobyric acid decarboxylase-like protein